MPVEKYNPEKFKFHITIHVDQDKKKIEKLKESILKKQCPFKIDIKSFGLYEIYQAKRIKKHECNQV